MSPECMTDYFLKLDAKSNVNSWSSHILLEIIK